MNAMDPNNLIKAAPEIAKGLTAVGAAIPFTGIVKRMLGPAADELAEMWKDQIRLYRYERQMKCVEKAEKMAEAAGITPQAVPPKILFPLLEGVSFEDDEDLHTMWAALLANTASPDNAKNVRFGFIAILKHMSPDEAALLNWIYDTADSSPPLNQITLIEAYARLGFGPADAFDRHEQAARSHTFLTQFAASRDSLEAARLIRRSVGEDDQTRYSISLTGRCFCFRLPLAKTQTVMADTITTSEAEEASDDFHPRPDQLGSSGDGLSARRPPPGATCSVEIDYRKPYKTSVEQIDGHVNFEGFDYIVQAR